MYLYSLCHRNPKHNTSKKSQRLNNRKAPVNSWKVWRRKTRQIEESSVRHAIFIEDPHVRKKEERYRNPFNRLQLTREMIHEEQSPAWIPKKETIRSQHTVKCWKKVALQEQWQGRDELSDDTRKHKHGPSKPGINQNASNSAQAHHVHTETPSANI